MDWLAELVGLPERFTFRSGGPGGGVIQARALWGGVRGAAATHASSLLCGVASRRTNLELHWAVWHLDFRAQGTSSEAVLVALLAARARSLRGRPPEDALRLVAYSSDQVRHRDAGRRPVPWLHARRDDPGGGAHYAVASGRSPWSRPPAACARRARAARRTARSRRRAWWRGSTTCASSPPSSRTTLLSRSVTPKAALRPVRVALRPVPRGALAR